MIFAGFTIPETVSPNPKSAPAKRLTIFLSI
jgi:hypothetical protein